MPHTTEIKKDHIAWIDFLRVAACFMVVFSHCCDDFVAEFMNDYPTFVTGVMAGSLVRPCVPLFVMISGVVLLPIAPHFTLRSFYRKRIGRFVLPLIFWSIVLPIAGWAYFNFINPASMNPALDPSVYTNESVVQRISTFIFNFNYDTTPLWYLYMLLGIYLILPIVHTWLEHASKEDIRLVLYLWFATLFIPYIKMVAPMLGYQGNYDNFGLFGECDWNIFGTFYYVSGFIGYIILAYYLVKYPLKWSLKRTVAIGVPMFLAGYAVTGIGYILTNEYYPGNYAYLEILWYFCGINVFMMTVPVFLLFQRIQGEASPLIRQLATLTLGIYLSHFVLVFVAYDIFDINGLPTLVRIGSMSVCVFTIAAFITWLLSKSKYTKALIQ